MRVEMLGKRRMAIGPAKKGLELHHRWPLEYANLMPKSDPNRMSNIIGLEKKIHDQVSDAWTAFRKGLNGREPTAAEVYKQVTEIDRILFNGKFVLSK